MNKLFLIRNPELFQGKKYLHKKKNYFEGWYFKTIDDKNSISFIPGISITDQGKKSFIQVITNTSSYYFDYEIDDFEFNDHPFYIKVGNNRFSKNYIHIDIKDSQKNIKIYGNIKYSNHKGIKTTLINPNIMGPFSYIPNMECNHAILSMKNIANGSITINNDKIEFNNDIGYIEKDWGTSFPKSYIWMQGNRFQNKSASFMLSVAEIPFKVFRFQGIICVLIVDNIEYRFTTYNHTKLIEYQVTDNTVNITLKKGNHILNVKTIYQTGSQLIAPVKGKMAKDITETITTIIQVTLKEKDAVIFSDTSINCGLEIVTE